MKNVIKAQATVAFGLISTNIVIKAQNLLGGKNLIKKMRKED